MRQWKLRAACRYLPPQLFFPEPDDQLGLAEARKVCVECPVIRACLEASFVNNEPAGVWGGYGEAVRRHLRRIYLGGDALNLEAEIADAINMLGTTVSGHPDERPISPARECKRCGDPIPAGVRAKDTNGPGANCGFVSTYNKGCRCRRCGEAKSRSHQSKVRPSPRGESCMVEKSSQTESKENEMTRNITEEEAFPLDSSIFGETSLNVTADDIMSFETWLRLGENISRMAEASPWWEGDWLNIGEERFPEEWTQGIPTAELDESQIRTKMNHKSVASRIGEADREPTLGFTFHRIAAPLGTKKALRKALKAAVAENMTTRQFQRYVDEMQGKEPVDEDQTDIEGRSMATFAIKVAFPLDERHEGLAVVEEARELLEKQCAEKGLSLVREPKISES